MSARSSGEIRVRYRGALVPPGGFDAVVAAGVGPDGPVVMWATAEGSSRLSGWREGGGGARFPLTRSPAAPAAAVAAYLDDCSPSDVVEVDELPVTFPLIQPLPGGAYLAVGARCAWRPEGPESNAMVIEPDGRISTSGCLGDGIGRLQTDADGTIWAGYYDEGVFGNLGWGRPGPTPLGAAGIVHWSGDFQKLWEPEPEEGVVDCGALNVGPDAVWACSDTESPAVRIAGGRAVAYGPEGVARPRGVVARGDRVGLISGPGLLLTARLAGGRLVITGRDELRVPDGGPLPRGALHCRGSVAHLFVDRDWYTFDLAEHDQS